NLFNNEVISYWNSNTPINRTDFNLPASTTFTIDNDGFGSIAIGTVVVAGTSSVSTSYFNFDASPPEAGVQVASSLTITPGASLNLARPLRQTAVASSRVGTISVNGTL